MKGDLGGLMKADLGGLMNWNSNFCVSPICVEIIA